MILRRIGKQCVEETEGFFVRTKLDDPAFEHMPTMRETTVWSPTLATRMRRLPLLTTVPAKTSSPAVFSL